MDCEVVRNLMSSYIDKDINEIDRIEFEEHLKNCADCMEEYNLLLSTVTYCNQLEEIELPETFHQELMGKIKELGNDRNRYKKNFFRRNWSWMAGVAAVFVVAAIGLSSLKGLPQLGTNDNIATEKAASEYRGAVTQSVTPAEAPKADKSIEFEFNESIDLSSIQDNAANYSLTMKAPDDYGTVNNQETLQSEEEIYERKIITTGSISLEVTDLDEKVNAITDLAEKSGGYVESSNVDNVVSYERDNNDNKEEKLKTGNLTLRLPAAKFKATVEEIKNIGEVISYNTNSVDISEQYYDTTTRINNLKVQENRLRELLSKAQTVDEILKIENELNRVRNDIELMTTDIRRWDKQVSLSTLYVYLKEIKAGRVEALDVPSIWTKAYNGFIGAINTILRGMEKLFIFVVSSIPYIIILAVISSIGYTIIRKYKKRKNV